MTSRQVGASKSRRRCEFTVGEADRGTAERLLISRSVHPPAGGW
ncbi:hypothetical protein MGAST_02745 [Mycobacterium gastri 'Wayne']|nr:hypothetical protein MGAST_02745 [Mycobacterium gastri 'Wayne']